MILKYNPGALSRSVVALPETRRHSPRSWHRVGACRTVRARFRPPPRRRRAPGGVRVARALQLSDHWCCLWALLRLLGIRGGLDAAACRGWQGGAGPIGQRIGRVQRLGTHAHFSARLDSPADERGTGGAGAAAVERAVPLGGIRRVPPRYFSTVEASSRRRRRAGD